MMDGMDMSMDNSTSAASMMTSFSTGLGMSNLWFDTWTPTSTAATFGACLGLLFLAIFSRFLSALRTSAELGWASFFAIQREIEHLPSDSSRSVTDDDKRFSSPSATPAVPLNSPRHALPFMWAIEVPRALLLMLQAFVGYLLMLAVMSYSAWFFIAILLGLGTGELLFGRWIAHSGGGDGGIHL